MNHLKKLKELKGKPHLYNGETLVIHDYELDEENLDLKITVNGTDRKMNMPIAEAHTFFGNLLPVAEPANATSLDIYKSQQASLATMRSQLMELNNKLMKDESGQYIKQAKALNNNVNTIINSLKLEFQVAKELRRNQDK